MTSDVKSAQAHQSGFLLPDKRVRIRAISVRGSANAGQLDLFATDTAPVSATYGQSGTTITVTSNSHGLKTGDAAGVGYSVDGSGKASTCGNRTITVVDANTFTMPCINSLTVSSGTACRYVVGPNEWLFTATLAATDIYQNYFEVPGAGLLAKNQPFASLIELSSVNIFYA
jgi:hypothetical protein